MRRRIPGFSGGLLGIGLLLAACNGGGGPTAVPEGDLIGKWVIRKFHSQGYIRFRTSTIPLDEDTVFTDDRSYMQLKADHTFVSDLPDPGSGGESTVEVGTWSLAGGTLTTIGSVDGVGEPDTLKWNVSLNGTDGVFSYHLDQKDSLVELKQDVVIDAVRK